MAAPVFTSRHLSTLKKRRPNVFGKFGSPTTATLLSIAAVGELIGDKLPITPDRIEVQSVIGRAVSGGVCGAAVARSRSDSWIAGGFIGTLAALASTYGAFHLRAAIGRRLSIPDPIVGAAEDGIALGIGLCVTRGLEA